MIKVSHEIWLLSYDRGWNCRKSNKSRRWTNSFWRWLRNFESMMECDSDEDDDDDDDGSEEVEKKQSETIRGDQRLSNYQNVRLIVAPNFCLFCLFLFALPSDEKVMMRNDARMTRQYFARIVWEHVFAINWSELIKWTKTHQIIILKDSFEAVWMERKK